ncbi:unnamed protein product, partial [Owenia fusiformis]
VSKLFLHKNQLKSFPDVSFLDIAIEELSLHENPWTCDCKLVSFGTWLKLLASSGRLLDKNVECKDQQGSVLDIANFNLICQQEIIIIAAVTSSVIISAIILTLSCIWIRHKTAVKVFLYTRFNWHPFDRYDEDDLCKKYDAFVCYSSRNPDTIKWMRETLLYCLEHSDPPYITYVHHRDFPIGNMIADTIAETIENSRRIIILLNNDFAKSPWGRLEFQLAHKKVLEDRRNRLIVIKMEEIEDAELDETIRHFMKTRTYLDVNDKKFWDKLFYALPEKRANKDMKEDVNVIQNGNNV